MAIATLWFGVLGAFSAVGALLDAFTRRLPNILCGAMLVVGLALAFSNGGWAALGLHAAHAAVALLIGYGLFLAGIFGGGDGKFYAATAAFFPLSQVLGLFVAMTAAGFVLAVGWFAAKRGFKVEKRLKGDFAKLPYGVAIASGAVAYAFLLSR